MRVDISLLPALAATFMLVFARIGAMVMLLPGFGVANIPVRVRLADREGGRAPGLPRAEELGWLRG